MTATGATPTSPPAAPNSASRCSRSSRSTTRRRRAAAVGSLLEIEPARRVALGALKAAGNPTARGSAQHVDADDGIVVRLVETHGRTTEVVVRPGCATSTRRNASTCWSSRSASADGDCSCTATRSPPCGHDSTCRACSTPTHSTGARCRSRRSRSTPGTGCTTADPPRSVDCPPSPTCTPTSLAVDPDAPLQLQLTAASDGTDAALHGKVRLVCPPGWTAAARRAAVRAAAGGATWNRPSTSTMPAGHRGRALSGARRTRRSPAARSRRRGARASRTSA